MLYDKFSTDYKLESKRVLFKIANRSGLRNCSLSQILDDVAVVLNSLDSYFTRSSPSEVYLLKATSYEFLVGYLACVLWGARFVVTSEENVSSLKKTGFVDIEVVKRVRQKKPLLHFDQLNLKRRRFNIGFFTSGSTRRPKLLFFTEKEVVKKVRELHKFFGPTRALSCLPLDHVYGNIFLLFYSFYYLRPTTLVEKFDVKLLNTVIPRAGKGLLFATTPAQIHLMNLYPLQMLKFLKKISIVTSAGGFLDKNTFFRFTGRYNGRLTQLYGLTEMLGSLAVMPNIKKKDFLSIESSPIGYPLKRIKIKIVNKRKPCREGQVGEIQIENRLLSAPLGRQKINTKDFGFYTVFENRKRFYFSHRFTDKVSKNDMLLNTNSLNQKMWNFDNRHFSKSVFLNLTSQEYGNRLSLVIFFPESARMVEKKIKKYIETHFLKELCPDEVFGITGFDLYGRTKLQRRKLKSFLDEKINDKNYKPNTINLLRME